MRTERGFTLTELIIVLVMIGVLAAVAVPRYIDLKNSANVSAVRHMMGVVKYASTSVNLKCRMTSSCSQTTWGGQYVLDGRTAQLLYGWLDAGTIPGVGNVGIDAFIETTPGFVAVVTPDHTETQWQLQRAANPATCYAFYRQQPGPTTVPDPNIAPTIGMITSGC